MLALATISLLSARQWAKGKAADVLFSHVPSYLEVEMLLAGVLLFAAVSLTGYPPSVNVTEETVTFSEIRVMYDPKFPRLLGPERILIDAPELTDLATGEIGKKEDVSWDRFTHNISGVIILATGIVALLEQWGGVPWARLWPLMFLGFSPLIFVFANSDHWPLGSIGFMASVQNPEVIQHWFAAMLVFGLGWFEWLVRTQASGRRSFQFVFPLLCIAGGHDPVDPFPWGDGTKTGIPDSRHARLDRSPCRLDGLCALAGDPSAGAAQSSPRPAFVAGDGAGRIRVAVLYKTRRSGPLKRVEVYHMRKYRRIWTRSSLRRVE